MSLEIIGGTFTPGEVKTFMVSGRRFELLDATGPVDVFLMNRAGSAVSSMRQAEASFFLEPDEGFEVIQVQSATAQTVRMFIGSGDAGTRRAAGSVSITSVADMGKIAALGGAAYRGTVLRAAAGATFFGAVQLWNGGAKNLIVSSCKLASSLAGQLVCGFQSSPYSQTGFTRVTNMRAGGAAPTATLTHDPLGGLAPQTVSRLGLVLSAANTPVEFIGARPIVVTPGVGLIAWCEKDNADVTATFEWVEE